MRPVIVLLAISLAITSCDTSPEEGSPQSQQSQPLSRKDARGKLEHMGVTYTEHAFVESARNGNTTAVALFLDAGMNPDVKDRNGQTALIAAAIAGHVEVIRLLLDKGAQVNSLGPLLLQDAAIQGQTDLVQTLLEKGVDANAQDGVGYTALMRAAEKGHTDTVKALVAKGANVNAQEMHGYSSLMWAVVKGKKDTAEVLLESGADANLQENKSKWTALMMAAVKGDTEMVKLLLDKGADATITDTSGATALAAAQKSGNPATVQLLEHTEAR